MSSGKKDAAKKIRKDGLLTSPEKGIEVKDIRKRKSSVAFQVMIKTQESNLNAPVAVKPSYTKKDVICMDDIQKKLLAAEERRKAQQEAMINNLRADDQKIIKAQLKKAELKKLNNES